MQPPVETKISVRDLVDGYVDSGNDGVVGFGGKLDIRPPYQREFIYKDAQRDAVIYTVANDFPLNVMYWAVRDDGNFEIIDGQQRTISICQFVQGDFSVKGIFSHPQSRGFHNLPDDEQNRILDYKLTVYQCSGTDSEKLQWFKTINIAGEELTPQELRNAVYAGAWVTDAKRYFSKHGCVAHGLGGRYLNGKAIRQEYLETVIKWISGNQTEKHMAAHQHETSATELWNYFEAVIAWVKKVFPTYYKEMSGLPWGEFYNTHKDRKFDDADFTKRVEKLRMNEDAKNSGIYAYLLTEEAKHLNVRNFDNKLKQKIYNKQKGICANKKCEQRGKKLSIAEMEADHIIPWSENGPTNEENCQMLCRQCNREKGDR